MIYDTFKYNASLIRARNTPFFTGDGTTDSAGLVDRSGNPIGTLKRLDEIHRTDWQGRQLLYPTARTNQMPASNLAAMIATGNKPPAITQNAEYAGQLGTSAVFGVVSGGNYANCVVTSNSTDAQFPPPGGAGVTYTASVWLNLSRLLVAGENILVMLRQNANFAQYQIAAGNSGQFVGQLGRIVLSGATVAASNIFIAAFAQNTATEITVFMTSVEVEEGETIGAYISTTTDPVTVTDYTLSGSTVSFGETPLAGAVCDWTGVAKR